jgi:uncharacterized protein (TIGR00251 family)
MQQTRDGVLLRLKVQPRSSRNEIVGTHGDAIRIRLTAPPVNGAANEALVRFLARKLRLSRRAIRLDQGHTGRTKLITILGAEVHQVTAGLGLG